MIAPPAIIPNTFLKFFPSLADLSPNQRANPAKTGIANNSIIPRKLPDAHGKKIVESNASAATAKIKDSFPCLSGFPAANLLARIFFLYPMLNILISIFSFNVNRLPISF